MPIEDRNLEIGTRLVGSYKKEEYGCTVEADEDGKLAYVLKDGRSFKSPSSAAGAVMGGKAVNGWMFWRLASGEEPVVGAPSAAEPEPETVKGKKLIYRLPNQRAVETGWTRYWCNGCMKGFTAEGSEVPLACPEGHRAENVALGMSVT